MILTGIPSGRQEPPAASLDAAELRELLPAALILESLAVRMAARFDAAAIDRLRRASARMRRTAADPAAAARAEDDFHGELVRPCRDARLRAMARSAQRALLPYRAAAPVTWGCELFGPLLLEGDVARRAVQYADGAILALDGPGLGVEIDEARLKEWARPR